MIGAAFPCGIKLTRADLDVTKIQDLENKVPRLQPSGIVHLANLDLRQCFRDPLLALKTNVHATQTLTKIAKDLGIPMVFVSSGSIFNGPMGSSFNESSRPDPLNFYAEAKVISEQIMLNQYPEGSLVIRTGWVFGGHGAHHRKYVDTCIEKAKKNETISAGEDNDGSPTFIKDLVQTMRQLILDNQRGLFHVVNSGPASPRDLAEHIVKTLKSQSRIESYHPNKEETQIPRSSCEVLVSNHLQLRPWREALTEYALQ